MVWGSLCSRVDKVALLIGQQQKEFYFCPGLRLPIFCFPHQKWFRLQPAIGQQKPNELLIWISHYSDDFLIVIYSQEFVLSIPFESSQICFTFLFFFGQAVGGGMWVRLSDPLSVCSTHKLTLHIATSWAGVGWCKSGNFIVYLTM